MALNEDLEFDRLIQDKRYKELISVLNGIINKLDSLNKESVKISMQNILSKVGEITPAIQLLANVIIEKLQPKETEWYFDIHRDRNGYITGITAKGK